MAAPYSNLRSKLDRAIVAYLKSVLTDVANIYPANNSGIKSLPCIVVRSHHGRSEEQFTGNWRFSVQIEIHAHAAQQPGDADTESQRIAADTLLSRTVDALMQFNTGDQNLNATAGLITTSGRALATSQADMADFTCLIWQETGLDGGNPKDGEGVDASRWTEIAQFEAVACPSAIN